MFRNGVYIGSIIRKVFQKKKMTVVQFANAVGCDRTRIYPIFESKSIDSDLLARISNVLDYDFLLEYYKVPPSFFYVAFAEADSSKIEELKADPSIKIIKVWPSV